MTARHLLLIVCFSWLFASCNSADGNTSRPSSVTPSLSTLSASTVTTTSTATPTALPTATAIPSPFTQLRAKSHQLLFTDSSLLIRKIYLFDYETAQLSLKIDVSHLSTYVGEGTALSPDAQILTVLQASESRGPTYIHQIDLPHGEVKTMLIAQDFQWYLPVVAGRMPPLTVRPTRAPIIPDPGDTYCNLDYVYHSLFKWAPNGHGFVFTISKGARCGYDDRRMDDQAQLYFVPRLGTKTEALALDSPLDAVGIDAKWSLDGNSILFVNRTKGVFIVGKAGFGTTISFPQTASYGDVAEAWWAPDSKSILFQTRTIVGGKDVLAYRVEGRSNLHRLDLNTGQVQSITQDRPVGNIGYWITNDFLAWANNGHDLVFIRNEVDLRLATPVYRSSYYYLDMNTGVTRLITDVSFPYLATQYTKVFENYLLLPTDNPCATKNTGFHFKVLSLPKGEVVFEPEGQSCIGLPDWSPDGHLISGYSGDDIVIWDLDTRTKTVIPMNGKKTIIGWIPHPTDWGKTLPAKTP